MSEVPSAAQLEQACRLVAVLTGSDLRSYKEGIVLRRLRAGASSRGMESIDAYLGWLASAGAEQQAEARKLFSSVSVRVSSFFRDEEVFRYLGEQVFPLLASMGREDEPLRVWSAACANGQEAYSLAIGLLDWLDKRQLRREFSVVGTDINDAAIAAAQLGAYPEKALADVPAPVRDRYFEPLPRGHFAVGQSVRRSVRFEKRDLLLDPLPSDFHLVSCRNFLIYLRREAQEELILALWKALRPGGFLVLGQGETVLGRPWKVFEHVSPGHKVYRRPP